MDRTYTVTSHYYQTNNARNRFSSCELIRVFACLLHILFGVLYPLRLYLWEVYYRWDSFFSYLRSKKREKKTTCFIHKKVVTTKREGNFFYIFHNSLLFSQKLWQRPVQKYSSREIESLKRQLQKVGEGPNSYKQY